MQKLTLKLLIVLVILSVKSFSQIPDGYYDGTQDLVGEDLKAALYNIIKGHNAKTYGDARYILDEADVDPNNEENVLVIYSAHSVSGTWDSGETWNREHVWAKSRGIGDVSNSTRGAGSDLHNLRACIPSVNSARGNRWFAECDVPYSYSGEETGSFKSTTDWFWKPRDEDKGDVARIIFYMATRYEGDGSDPDLEVVDEIPSDDFTTSPVHALLSDLMAWHIEDPVSDFELHRNEIIYDRQSNRNPFIDHPEFVDLIWGEGTSVAVNSKSEIAVYPNPTKEYINISGVDDVQKVSIYNVIGREVKNVNAAQNIFVGDLQKGQYFMVVNAKQISKAVPFIVE